jgi:hypothetical protein
MYAQAIPNYIRAGCPLLCNPCKGRGWTLDCETALGRPGIIREPLRLRDRRTIFLAIPADNATFSYVA